MQKAYPLRAKSRPNSAEVNGYHSSVVVPKTKRHRKSAVEMLRDHGQRQIRGPAPNPKRLSDVGDVSATATTATTTASRGLLHGNSLSSAIRASGPASTAVSLGPSKSNTGADNGQVPVTLHAGMLHGATIIGQAASKFILMKSCDNTLLCVDQHAADERVQLEKLERRYREALRRQSWGHSGADDVSVANGGNVLHVLQVYTLAEPLVLRVLPQEEERVGRFAAELSAWKFAVRVGHPVDAAAAPLTGNARRSLNGAESLLAAAQVSLPSNTDALPPREKMLIMSAVPMLFGLPLTARDMRLYLQELCDRGTSMRSFRPSFVTRILNSLACKLAIKFGASLGRAECKVLVRELAACALPFQCAHGRPSVVPLAAGGALSSCLGLEWQRTVKRKGAATAL